MSNPTTAKVNGKIYKINTDFRTAIECNSIAEDKTIDDYERALAIIYKLFGDEGLQDTHNYEDLLKVATMFLNCGKEIEESDKKVKKDMDFVQDMDYIEASFMSDFHIDLETSDMHFWKFMKLMNGLSNSEMGNCCVLNNVRNLRNYDVSQIKDAKERQKIIEAKQAVALQTEEKQFTQEEQNAIDKFNKLAGL